VTAIAAGACHSLAVKSGGAVRAWGRNANGQLGDGTTTQRKTPVQVSGLTGATKVGGGDFHSLGLAPAAATRTTAYGYDRLHRLTSAVVTGGDSTSYAYDPVGNRLTRTRNGIPTGYAYDRADRITSAGGVSHTVNAAGNLTARGGDTLGYDQAHRLTTATVGGVSSQDAYDGDGKRASQTVGAATTRYIYDVAPSLPLLLEDGARKYVWGLGLAYATDLAGTVQGVYHADGLGSVRALTSAGGVVTDTYQTDEFGAPTQTTGSSGQPFGYTGEQRDGATGLVYLRARMYDPSGGRFVQRDPWPGALIQPSSLQRYAYAENNPVNFIDPSGLKSEIIDERPTDGSFMRRCAGVICHSVEVAEHTAVLGLGRYSVGLFVVGRIFAVRWSIEVINWTTGDILQKDILWTGFGTPFAAGFGLFDPGGHGRTGTFHVTMTVRGSVFMDSPSGGRDWHTLPVVAASTSIRRLLSPE
jgi:RHS repeat-associated protein